MKVLVTGGRKYADTEHLEYVLDHLHANNVVDMVIHGAASGADRMAGSWASKRCITEVIVPAQWTCHDRRAGYIRNKAMADLGPDVVVAFPGGAGTDMMIRIARASAIKGDSCN